MSAHTLQWEQIQKQLHLADMFIPDERSSIPRRHILRHLPAMFCSIVSDRLLFFSNQTQILRN